ncbi:hypothetical protein [Kitasatospora sp. CB01950]|uniref:hypothetical protein n=1 Tax=Kitasatospora sp. CB01950 TaxID=1703930 RepID=UPI00096588A0|nr:hypothetical protein AMK19_09630 [Kitasatospora sp. CB01950]
MLLRCVRCVRCVQAAQAAHPRAEQHHRGHRRQRAGRPEGRAGAAERGGGQRPDQQTAFAAHQAIPFPLLSDAALRLTGALRLPTFRAGGAERLKRVTLLLDATRTVRGVLYPVPDPGGSVQDALALIDAAGSGR